MNLLIHCLKVLNNALLFLVFLLLFTSCKESKLPLHTTESLSQQQGVAGNLIYKEGIFDSKNNLLSNGTIIGVSRKIYFYELTGLKEVEMNDGNFIQTIHSTLIDSTLSDKDGNFAASLKPGKYSVFIDENERLYSQVSDEGVFIPVTVYKDSVTVMNIYIDYKADYSE
jgi:hypothetical protein